MVLNEETNLPEPSPEILTIPQFLEVWETVYKIDGDRDGTKKKFNLRIFGYIHFHAVYDSRFRQLNKEEKDLKIRELLKLTSKWIPDPEVLDCIRIYADMQITASQELVDSLEGTNIDLSKWVKAKRALIAAGTAEPRDVSAYLDIMERLPSLIETVKKAKITLEREHDVLATGRGGRRLNLFELP